MLHKHIEGLIDLFWTGIGRFCERPPRQRTAFEQSLKDLIRDRVRVDSLSQSVIHVNVVANSCHILLLCRIQARPGLLVGGANPALTNLETPKSFICCATKNALFGWMRRTVYQKLPAGQENFSHRSTKYGPIGPHAPSSTAV